MKLKRGLRNLLGSGVPPLSEAGPISIETLGAANWTLLEDVFDMAQIALWEWDIPTDRVRGTRQLYEIFGIQSGAYDNRLTAALDALVHPEHQSYVRMVLKDTLRSGGVDRFKFRIVRPDGQERWLMVKARVGSEGSVATGLIMDCSQTQNAELSLYKDLDFIQTMVDAIPNPIFYKDAHGRYQFCNLAFAQMLGTHRDNILGKTVYDVSRHELAEVYHQKDLELMRSGGVQEYESKVQIHTGEDRTYRFHKGAHKDIRGLPIGLVGVMTDITELISLNERNRRLLDLRDAMLEVSQAVMGLQDAKNLLEMLLSKALSVVRHADIGAVLLKDDEGYLRVVSTHGYVEAQRSDFRLKIEETFVYKASGGRFDRPVIINDIPEKIAQGCPKTLDTQAGPVVHSCVSTPIVVEGQGLAMINIDSYKNEIFQQDDLDLMKYLKAQAELALTNLKLYQDTVRMSQEDPLTGIMNRGHFERVFQQYLSRTHDFEQCLSLVLTDIDGLKATNDLMGHAEGDRRIRQYVEQVKSVMGEEDLFGRYGGDEFVLVLFGKNRMEAETVLKTLLDNLVGKPDMSAFSFGVAQYPLEGQHYLDLVKLADRRMYEDKRKKTYGRRREDHGDQDQ